MKLTPKPRYVSEDHFAVHNNVLYPSLKMKTKRHRVPLYSHSVCGYGFDMG